MIEAHLRTGKENPYQAAFSHLHRTHGPDEVGRVIREAFLRARTSLDAALTGAAVQGDEQVCRDLENDLAGWHVSAAVFGNSRKPLEVQYPQLLARIDFTPAVIPVTREFLEMAGLRPYSVYPDLDHLAKEVTDSNIPAPVTRSPRANRSRRKTPC